MVPYIASCVAACLIAGLVGMSCRLRTRRQWFPLISVTVALALAVNIFDSEGAGVLVIETFLAALATSVVLRVTWGRQETPSLFFTLCVLLVFVVVAELFIGPKLRDARELGRRQWPAEEQRMP